MVAKRLEATTRFGVKLTPEERVKLALMSKQMDVSESEVLRMLIVSGIIIEKPVNNLLLEISDDISKMRAEINDLSSKISAKNYEIETRLQEVEDVLVGEIVERQPVSQPFQTDSKEIPTLAEFSKQFTPPAMPSQLESFKEMVKQEYIKKFGVSPT